MFRQRHGIGQRTGFGPNAIRLALFASLCVGESFLTIARADDWPQWRGPRRDGVSLEKGLLAKWPEGGPPLAWQVDGVGTGYASVVVENGRLFTLGAREGDVIVTARNSQTGEPIWSTKIGTTSRNPCSTPTADGDRVYALGPDGQLVCLESATGERIWRRDLLADFGGRLMSGRGYGESPLIDGDRLICTPGGEGAQIVALDKGTGQSHWLSRFPDLGEAGRDGAAFSSIVISEGAGVKQYVQLMGRGLVAVAADDGRFLWHYGRITNQTANIPTPIVQGDLVFAANGYGVGSVLLRLVADDKPLVNQPPKIRAEEVYFLTGGQFQNHHGGVVRVGEQIFGGHGSNNGLPTCIDLATGKIHWKQRGPGVGSAAVVSAGDRLYFRYQNGLVALLAANTEGFEVQGTLQVATAGGDSWAHPVVANGRLYLREQDTLLAYDVRSAEGREPAGQTARSVTELDNSLPLFKTARVEGDRLVFDSKTDVSIGHRLYVFAVSDKERTPAVLPVICTIAEKQLEEGAIPESVLRPLRALDEPVIVSLAGTSVRGESLKRLRSLPRLVGLNLEHCRELQETDLTALRGCDALRVLVLTGTTVSTAGIEELQRLPELQALDLEVCDGIHDDACDALGRLSGLRALVLKKTGFEKRGISDAGLNSLTALKKLWRLDLYGNKVTDAGLSQIGELVELRELNLSLMAITDAGLPRLAGLQELRRLELLYSEGFAGPMLTDAGLKAFEPLRKLEWLDLTGAKVTDAGLSALGAYSSLKRIRLNRTRVTAAGVEKLRTSRPELRVDR